MPHERWKQRVQDILTAIQKIQRYTAGLSFRTFANDEKTVDAVVRNLSIIGEAARNIPSEMQARSPDIPWAEMRGMRHRIVHEYLTVDTTIVWQTISEDLPPLIPLLQALLTL